jgi:hypothetical protein
MLHNLFVCNCFLLNEIRAQLCSKKKECSLAGLNNQSCTRKQAWEGELRVGKRHEGSNDERGGVGKRHEGSNDERGALKPTLFCQWAGKSLGRPFC